MSSTLGETVAASLAAGEPRAARAALASAVLANPSASTCHTVSHLLDSIDPAAAGLTPARIALLTNYTADALLPLIRARALPSGLAVTCHLPGFDTAMQEVLAEDSALRAFDPNVVFIDLLAERVVPELIDSFLSLDQSAVDAAIATMSALVADMVNGLRRWSTARVVIHLVARPFGPTLGLLDVGARSQRAAIECVNEAIRRATAGSEALYLDSDRLVAEVGARDWRDQRLWSMATIPYGPVAMHRIADEYVRYLRALTGRVRKVLVLDLDDTLWGGVLGERGEHGIELGPTRPGNGFVGFQRAIAELHRRGVILAINSSNDAEHALSVIDRHPSMVLRAADFLAHRINWSDKAANMVAIADELNLGLDSFVFIDNSDAECARIRQALPDVLTCQLAGDPSGYGPWLRQSGLFDSLGFTEEDRQRTQLYRDESRRTQHRESMASLDEYLRSLEMVLIVEPVGAATVDRAADLSQRTNQFNMTTRRRTAQELSALCASAGYHGYVFRLSDRFGAQGIIAFAAWQPGPSNDALITDLLISCRVLKRNVETAILSVLAELARSAGAGTLAGEFRPTQRNRAFAAFFEAHGFTAITDTAHPPAPDGATFYRRSLDVPLTAPAYIELQHARPSNVS